QGIWEQFGHEELTNIFRCAQCEFLGSEDHSAACPPEGGERSAELLGKANALHQILKSPIRTDGFELWRNVQINEMERVLGVSVFQQLKCLFVVTKRDVDRLYFLGRHVLSLPKLIQLIEHFIRFMLLLRLRICANKRSFH